ncbi:CBS domain-containing protein [Natronoarchaeum philippinense]|uniref:CBS domain-containing protein n=1 Tax=Natronoarchaeum philippinense TaxID=558529 RepID=A0A285N3W2_NATPI|nr:CBS domain-containing protein [Natronoarchaeum philippinense]SNZ04164.1 CBS domain-containing protein [Natronoarchaeum philippinense]
MDDDVTVRDMMSREYVGVSESDAIADVADVLCDDEAGLAAVVRGSRPVGVVTAHDLLRYAAEDTDGATVGDVMREPEPTTAPDSPFVEALDLMSTQGTRRLLVTDEQELVGVLTADDALTAAASLLDNGVVEERRPQFVGTNADGGEIGGELSDDRARGESGYSSQSVCESCGTLTRDLQNFNGQMICADCRDV